MSPTLVAIIKSLILPPGILILVVLAVGIVFRNSRKTILIIFYIVIAILYLISTPFVARQLAGFIEPDGVFDLSAGEDAQAIVILGCNLYINAPEYENADDVSSCTLVRLRYAAEVFEKARLPIMTCGGSVFGKSDSEADVMARVLKSRFGVKTTWKENLSTNTYQNAKNAAVILSKENINTIILVTHAIHMRRSKYSFEKNGIKVIPAPTYFTSISADKPMFLDLLPSVSALSVSRNAIHESIGYIWHVVKES